MSRSRAQNQAGFRWANLALLGAALVLTFLALELVFKTIEPTSPPGTTYGVRVSRNRDGFRDREYVRPKPAGTYRILVLGDSFTWGIGLRLQETIPKVLESLLRDATELKVEVVNGSQPGHNTVEELEQLQRAGLSYEPDMVLLIYNLNDIKFVPQLATADYDPTAVVPVVEVERDQDLVKFSEYQGLRGLILSWELRSALLRFLVPRIGSLLRRMNLIQSVEFSWVEKIYQGYTLENPGWLESRRALAEIRDQARARNMKVVLAIYPLLVELDNYQGRAAHRSLSAYCESLGITVVDLLPIFEGKRGKDYWINFMDSHPNAAAHRMVAQRLLPFVLRLLPPEPRSPQVR